MTSKGRAMSLTSITTPPYPRKVRLWVFLVLPAMNGPLPAELKFKENTVSLPYNVFFFTKDVWSRLLENDVKLK